MVMTWHGIRMAFGYTKVTTVAENTGDQPALGAEVSRTGGA